MSELKVNRATVIEWLDANEIEVTHTQLAGLFSSAIEAAQAQEDAPDDSELEDLAHSANQEALSYGVSLDVFLRLAKTVRLRAATAPQQAAQDAPVDAERWLDLLADARAALWQPANAALCERLDAFIDAARAARERNK